MAYFNNKKIFFSPHVHINPLSGQITPDEEAKYLTRQYTSISNTSLSLLPDYGCCEADNLVSFYAPNCVYIGSHSFENADLLESVVINLNQCGIYTNTFAFCESLRYVDTGNRCNDIGAYAFRSCEVLETLIIRNTELCPLSNTNAFKYSGIEEGTGYVYVPSALVDSYKTAANWSVYANQIRAIEDYPEITARRDS